MGASAAIASCAISPGVPNAPCSQTQWSAAQNFTPAAPTSGGPGCHGVTVAAEPSASAAVRGAPGAHTPLPLLACCATSSGTRSTLMCRCGTWRVLRIRRLTTNQLDVKQRKNRLGDNHICLSIDSNYT